ncbi:Heterokaryon incompatibility [Macrophomina phaseolina MS6]|uniref:Heterokaryon incompatibility n=1 Tax=Macrophomina phaseolina (strain MS6) TaxID=1126212 RepID=K2RHE1_MACPH|nr:Heterokaryon incompatibility [Macrophomina phaseolina MS6]
MNTYNYKRTELHQGEIRLFKLHPGSGSDRIEGNLIRYMVKKSSLSERYAMGIPNHSNNAEEPGSGNSSKPAEDYLALSYTWGPPAPRGQEKFIKVIDTDESYRIDVKPNLHAALVRLRHCEDYVFLWIDAICINQNDNREKSAQIPRMSEIYNGAKRVCIWLGPAGENSNTAMDFVHECLNLDDFDRRFNQEFSEKWHAVSNLLRRPWFSRRWIVQELARARKAEVYCGDHMPIQWQDFADGVSLMSSYQKDIKRVFFESQQFGHHPDFVGDLQELAAVKLIHIVNNVFRKSDNGEVIEELLSLDALMSSLPAFEASDPRDVMYAILWLANDARPGVKDSEIWKISQRQKSKSRSMEAVIPVSPALLSSACFDYFGPDTPSTGPSRRPSFARTPDGNSLQVYLPRKRALSNASDVSLTEERTVSSPTQMNFNAEPWGGLVRAPPTRGAALNDATIPELPEENLDEGDGHLPQESTADPPSNEPFPAFDRRPRAYSDAAQLQVPSVNNDSSLGKRRRVEGHRLPEEIVVHIPEPAPEVKKSRMKENAAHKWVGRVIEKWIIVDYDRSVFQVCKDYLKFSLARSKSLDMLLCPWAPIERPGDEPLPSWIPKLSEKPFGPDADGVYRRVNADTLVGTPGLTSRIYSASRNTRADVKWCRQDEKSISVKGFILDRVASKGSCAMEGVIPADWLTTGNWDDGGELPPDRFWRSLIGNLDSHGHRPPPHWKRICRDAFKRRRYGGNLDTKQIINHGGPSPIREFLERVQCVIWQRRMITLKQLGQRSIGIGPKAVKKGDLVCILYGCSVPVVLRQMVDGRPVSKDAEILAEEDRGDVHYQVVGECFIHGMMNGEAWALKGLDPREREREFKLH